MSRIKKILIANRGEIAVRVIRTARKLGIRTVAVYSAADADSLHVAAADESWCIGEAELNETYLNITAIVELAVKTGCDAIHPGYGFLAENAAFVRACVDAGIIFIGPDTESMRIMGNKIGAREFVKKTGIPMTAGISGTPAELKAAAASVGFPVLLKAAAGGGGKGMKIVYREEELDEAIVSAARQAQAYFGDDTVYIEKYIEEPRHIEIQILGDHFGNVIHLFERECSIQRRYQKIIEESPSPTLTPQVREQMGLAAVAIGKAIGYRNAGTIEFLVDKDLHFYFLEMNTRIQVEHPVTEMVTGIDIVEEQILIASGIPLRYRQDEVMQQGHAIECRVYAEDPSDNFTPSPGKMTLYHEPALPGIRIDTGITAKTEIKSLFDPMICKLIATGKDRYEASHQMLLALQDYTIQGIKNNLLFLKAVLESEAFAENSISTRFCDEHTATLNASIMAEREKIPHYMPVIGYLVGTLKKASQSLVAHETPGQIWQETGFWRNRMDISVLCEDKEVNVYLPGYNSNGYHFRVEATDFIVTPLIIEHQSVAFILNNRHYHLRISEKGGNEAIVSLYGHQFHLRRNDLLPEATVASGFDRHGSDSMTVVTPMPGKVIRIMVSAGVQVNKGDGLLIIEAMKMENLIVSPRDGKIKEVRVGVGDRVESNKGVVEFED